MASLEWLFREDLKDSHYSFEIDLSLCIWPPASSVQSCVTVPRSMCACILYVGRSRYVVHLQISALLVRISKN